MKLILLMALIIVNTCSLSAEEICFTTKEGTSILSLLDASAEDIKSLDRCSALLKEIELSLETKDKRIVSLTNDLIRAKQDKTKYQRKYEVQSDRLKYSLGLNVLLIIIQLLPLI